MNLLALIAVAEAAKNNNDQNSSWSWSCEKFSTVCGVYGAMVSVVGTGGVKVELSDI